jgi:hypothetical protein
VNLMSGIEIVSAAQIDELCIEVGIHVETKATHWLKFMLT